MSRRKLRSFAKNINYSPGDAITGERVIAQARKIGNIIIVPGSSGHQIQQTTLKTDVFCIIDKSFRKIERQLRLKT